MSDTNRTVYEKEARIGIEALHESIFWSNQYAGFFENVMNGPVELKKGLDLANCARSQACSSVIYLLALLPKEHRVDALNSILSDTKTFILEKAEGLFK